MSQFFIDSLNTALLIRRSFAAPQIKSIKIVKHKNQFADYLNGQYKSPLESVKLNT